MLTSSFSQLLKVKPELGYLMIWSPTYNCSQHDTFWLSVWNLAIDFNILVGPIGINYRWRTRWLAIGWHCFGSCASFRCRTLLPIILRMPILAIRWATRVSMEDTTYMVTRLHKDLHGKTSKVTHWNVSGGLHFHMSMSGVSCCSLRFIESLFVQCK